MTKIDSDNESLADALEPLSDVSDKVDKDNVIPEVPGCSVRCLESALDMMF